MQSSYSFVSSAWAFVRQRIVSIRKLAYCGTALGVLAVGVAVAVAAADSSQHTVALAILGGTLAATPYMIVRALEEVVRDESGGERLSGRPVL